MNRDQLTKLLDLMQAFAREYEGPGGTCRRDKASWYAWIEHVKYHIDLEEDFEGGPADAA
jgi:hypothetical protein